MSSNEEALKIGKPSTSSATPRANDNDTTPNEEPEVDPNDEELNESLEAFAKTYNLTAQNVKNIIYHVIKNPQTFSTVIAKDPEAIATLRMTRARQKELERISNVKLDIELKPVSAPTRSFLQVNYADEDEEDADYQPADDEDNPDENDNDQEDDTEFPESNADWGELVDDENAMPDDLLTEIDNPDYLNFVRSVAAPNNDEMFLNEDDVDDDEYNVIQNEMDLFDREEFRMDRTTRIPRWELNALREDWIYPGSSLENHKKKHKRHDQYTLDDDDDDMSPFVEAGGTFQQPKAKKFRALVEEESEGNNVNNFSSVDGGLQPSTSSASIERQEAGKCGETSALSKEAAFNAEINTVQGEIGPQQNERDNVTSDGSSCLFKECVKFSEEEMKTLRVQLQKHVQLLTQCIVGTYGENELVPTRNRALEMIHELDQEYHSQCNRFLSDVPNLPHAIFSCHDILACQSVKLPASATPSYYLSPRNEVMWVFSRSRALVFPQLVPDIRFCSASALNSPTMAATQHNAFLPSEQNLLALALFELHHVKHSSWSNVKGRYSLIIEHFLPTRSVTQVRNHLKNLRSSPAPTPIHHIIMQAQEGVLNAEFVLDADGFNAQAEPPINWPERLQPEWLKNLPSLFKSGAVQVFPNSPDEDTVKIVADKPILTIPVDSYPTEVTAEEVVIEEGNLEICDEEGEKVLLCGEIVLKQKKDKATPPKNLTDESVEDAVHSVNVEENSREPDVSIGSEEVSNDVASCGNFLSTAGNESSTPVYNSNMLETENEDVDNGGANSSSKPKSRRKLQVEKGIEKLCNDGAREEVLRSLIEAVNNDCKQRLFTHQDKLKDIQSLVLQTDNVEELFHGLRAKLSAEQHSHLLALLGALAPDDQFTNDSDMHNDAKRLAYRKALEMFINIYTYLTGSRSSAAARNVFKNMKDIFETCTEGEVYDRMRQQFGSRDSFLWKMLRTHMPDEKFNERVEEWQYEFIDVDKLQESGGLEIEETNESLKFESIDVPYNPDPLERAHLRLRHGRLTMEHNGRLKTVNVGFTTDSCVQHGDGRPNSLPTTAAPWTRDDDRLLLTGFQRFGGDTQKTIEEFLAVAKTSVSALEASRRLAFLIGMVKKVQLMDANQVFSIESRT